MIRRILIPLYMAAVMFACVYAGYAAVVTNSQGSGGAPVAVGTAATEVIPPNSRRIDWSLISESVALRCVAGKYTATSGAFASPTPEASASIGFYIPSGVVFTEKQVYVNLVGANPSFAPGEDFAKLEIDCYVATGSTATNVDTWEETLPNSLP